ncbi:organic cation transporter protein-like [Ischnura elegans]|uniref:organic cation transporter protein-like n=1 Tax=Ischnura elegans TaxID=197161 RepID=UPI001ED8AE09|nr:organic cation transporter protein-like [Ischnura elegans]
MLGILVGSVFFGIMADKFGRKIPLLASIALQTTAGIAAACIQSFEGFLVLRFLIAFATGGMMMTSFVICMEIVGGWWRTAVPILYHLPFGLGYSALGGISYYFRSWRQLQLVISVPCTLLLSYWWLIPESPRWLLAMDHHNEAEKVLGTAAKVNGRVWNNAHLMNLRRHKENRVSIVSIKFREPNIIHNNDSKETFKRKPRNANYRKRQKGHIFDLLKTPNLRRKTLAISYSWLASGLAFFGAAQYMSRLGGNIFINVAISGATQVVGTLLSWYLMHTFGRRNTLLVSHLFSGVSCLLIACVLKGWKWLPVALAANGLIGLAVVLSTNYLYSCELFPTVVRNAGIGVASMCARIGSLTAPFIATLDTIHPLIPPITFGIFPLVAGILVLLLPETSNQHLPDTIQEGEDFGKKKN